MVLKDEKCCQMRIFSRIDFLKLKWSEFQDSELFEMAENYFVSDSQDANLTRGTKLNVLWTVLRVGYLLRAAAWTFSVQKSTLRRRHSNQSKPNIGSPSKFSDRQQRSLMKELSFTNSTVQEIRKALVCGSSMNIELPAMERAGNVWAQNAW